MYEIWKILEAPDKKEKEEYKYKVYSGTGETNKCTCGGNCSCHNKQKATLKLEDGREIQVEISEEELKKIEVKKSPYTREFAKKYFYVDDFGYIKREYDDRTANHNMRESICNFYSDEKFATYCARADHLMRRLRKFAIEANMKINGSEDKASIIINNNTNPDYQKIELKSNIRGFGHIFFKRESDCKKAIEMFHDDLVWYFTEYIKIYE